MVVIYKFNCSIMGSCCCGRAPSPGRAHGTAREEQQRVPADSQKPPRLDCSTPVPRDLKGPRRLTPRSHRPRSRLPDGVVPAEPPAPTRSAPRAHSGCCGFAQAEPSLSLHTNSWRPTLHRRVAVVPAGAKGLNRAALWPYRPRLPAR